MSSPAATSSSHYRILDSKEAHNNFDHTNSTAKLHNYILEPCSNHINLTLDQNVTPTDLNLLRTAIRCARSQVTLIETIKKLEDSIIDITSILVNRDVDMLLLSKPTSHPKLKTPSTPSLPSSAKVSEPRTFITVNLCTSSDENPSSARLSPIIKKPNFQKPTGRTGNQCSLCKCPGHYFFTCTIPPCFACGVRAPGHYGNLCKKLRKGLPPPLCSPPNPIVRATPKPASSMAHSTMTRALALWAHT